MLMPKLPLVSNSRILDPSARLSHTLILPSNDVAARYWPSSERAMAHISPALLPSTHHQHPFFPSHITRGEEKPHPQSCEFRSIGHPVTPTPSPLHRSLHLLRLVHYGSWSGGDSLACEPSRGSEIMEIRGRWWNGFVLMRSQRQRGSGCGLCLGRRCLLGVLENISKSSPFRIHRYVP